MKTVTGAVISSKPVSLSKAARILSNFASSDNEASPAFAAYLKRASASFNELVQLHKELKGSGSELKGKKHRSSGNVTDETVNFVSEDGLPTEEKEDTNEREKHRGDNRGEGEVREIEGSLKIDNEIRRHKTKDNRDFDGGENAGSDGMRTNVTVNGNAADEGGDGKRMKKKKRESDAIVLNADKDQSYGSHDVVDVKGDKNDIGSEHGSKEMRKKKGDEGKKDKSDGAVGIKKEEQVHPHGQDDGNVDVTEIVETDGSKGKKHRKKKEKRKEERERSDVEGAEQKDIINGRDGNIEEVRTTNNMVEGEGGVGKKHKKKRNHEGGDRESGGKVENEEAYIKENKKRKYEGVVDGGLDESEEQHRSKKKKKRKSEEV